MLDLKKNSRFEKKSQISQILSKKKMQTHFSKKSQIQKKSQISQKFSKKNADP